MSCQQYKNFNFRKDTLRLIAQINSIIAEYTALGYRLTVRQLYYQLVARGVIPNTQRDYDNTQELLNNARLAGLVDWDAIEDRTRAFVRRSRWLSAHHLVDGAAKQFHMDPWTTQDVRVFCIVEKEALVGVLESTCYQWDVPLLAARGYPSASVMREFALHDLQENAKQTPIILHLGDHDPSGIDMTRDLHERFALFATEPFVLQRIALTMAQIEVKNPPPNPAKVTDSRFKSYMSEYGAESWELDALDPTYLNALVSKSIKSVLNLKRWETRQAEIEAQRKLIQKAADNMKSEKRSAKSRLPRSRKPKAP